ncbi:hypothetical protein E1193_13475 [Micromonospora sp. KC606]|uniref:DUF7426 family protein n=1 Tax=Micromonospora sp. KC606 TaxID=2530379 RepID=UPI00104ADE99|nr:hypothetical protein [Micromonospora sp. KC606]TDC81908.1 hypothetical protein E1193_13475 [Micromonospora sp. KC606]
MGRFGDLDDYFDPGLTLTVKGKEYTLPLPSAELGLWCRRIALMAGEAGAASTDEELADASSRAHTAAAELPPLPGAEKLSFEQLLLGPVYAEMMSDGVPDPYIQFCAQTAYIWIIAGEEQAARYWHAGGRPEARGPGNRADRRRMRTGGGAGTPAQASTSGTRSPTTSGGNGRARRSRGRRS